MTARAETAQGRGTDAVDAFSGFRSKSGDDAAGAAQLRVEVTAYLSANESEIAQLTAQIRELRAESTHWGSVRANNRLALEPDLEELRSANDDLSETVAAAVTSRQAMEQVTLAFGTLKDFPARIGRRQTSLSRVAEISQS